jgi:hypothetical protein
MNYDEACAAATADQGLQPIIDTLTAAGLPHQVEQTGGFCMVVVIPLDEGQTSFLNIVDAYNYFGEPWSEAGEGFAGSRYWACNGDAMCEGQCEGQDIISGDYAMMSAPLCDLMMYVRQHIADPRPCPCDRLVST